MNHAAATKLSPATLKLRYDAHRTTGQWMLTRITYTRDRGLMHDG